MFYTLKDIKRLKREGQKEVEINDKYSIQILKYSCSKVVTFVLLNSSGFKPSLHILA